MILSPRHGRSRQFFADDRNCQTGTKIGIAQILVMKQWQDYEYSQVLLGEIAITARKSRWFWTANTKQLLAAYRNLAGSQKGLCPRFGKML
ncbi:hypothetical protein N9N21_01375 [Alphaproteobacteria bacterium]|nr:hypothetical protein [Alphaproteobacteria bacterium]